MTPRSWDSIQMLAVSLYPEPAVPKPLIRYMSREAARRGIQVSWKVQDKFTCLDRDRLATHEEARGVFNSCWIRHRCNSIEDGRFYCCTRPQYVQKFAPVPEWFCEDGVEVHDEDTGSLALRIQAHLRGTEPLRSCYLCQGGDAPLETQRQLHPREVAAKRERLVTLAAAVQ